MTKYLHLKFIFVVLSIHIFNGVIYSQETLSRYDRFYGLDPNIYSGEFYTLYQNDINGSAFLFEDGFVFGTIFIEGKPYPEILLNYDIYNEDLIIQALTKGMNAYIKISSERVDSFIIDQIIFDKVELAGEKIFMERIIPNNKIFYRQ